MRRALTAVGALLLVASLGLTAVAREEDPVAATLRSLALSESDLPGYTHVRPDDMFPVISGPGTRAADAQGLVRLNADLRRFHEDIGRGSIIYRTLYDRDTPLQVEQKVVICDTAEGPARFAERPGFGEPDPLTPGTLTGTMPLGDASWVRRLYLHRLVRFTCGRAIVAISVSARRLTTSGVRLEGEFADETAQAIAETVFLRIARRPDIAGKPLATVAVTVNGVALTAPAPLVAGRAAVPVLEVAKRAGWQGTWDAATAQARLQPPTGSALVLTFASPNATVGEGVIPLRSALFKDGAVPVMDVEELATLMGGTIQEAEGRIDARI